MYIGRYEGTSPDRPAIMLGSHVDTVIMAGKYDGGLGIVTAIDCVRSLDKRGIRFANPIEVVGFADEEGVRFQSTYLGSRALAGTFETDMLDRADRDGITLAEAMKSFGLDPGRIGQAARTPEELVCYLEVHIEQGPVLENEDLAVAAVTAISGANRMTVTIDGEAGHAGTVPMSARRDPLLAASECVLAVEEFATKHPEAVGTVGDMSVSPGATNVIPGKVVFSVDFRAPDDEVRSALVNDLTRQMVAIADRRSVTLSVSAPIMPRALPAPPWIVGEIEAAMGELGLKPRQLPSGAGHDAAAMAEITDVGMIFVRCAGGIKPQP